MRGQRSGEEEGRGSWGEVTCISGGLVRRHGDSLPHTREKLVEILFRIYSSSSSLASSLFFGLFSSFTSFSFPLPSFLFLPFIPFLLPPSPPYHNQRPESQLHSSASTSSLPLILTLLSSFSFSSSLPANATNTFHNLLPWVVSAILTNSFSSYKHRQTHLFLS